jgi:hypothetical protein
MIRLSFKTLSLWLAALACLVVPARAEVVLSNLTVTDTDSSDVSLSPWLAQSFVTNNQAWTLTSATLFLKAYNSSGNLFVNLYSNATDVPGSSLGTLSGSDNPTSEGQYTYTSTGISLDPSTTYWLVAGVSSGDGSYGWVYDNTGSITSTGAWSIPSTTTYAVSTDVGGSWGSYDGFPLLFSIEATATTPSAVPEIDPNSVGSVLALVLGSLGLLERRRLKAA